MSKYQQAIESLDKYRQIVEAWNSQADEHNQWATLDEEEKVNWAFNRGKEASESIQLSSSLEYRIRVAYTDMDGKQRYRVDLYDGGTCYRGVKTYARKSDAQKAATSTGLSEKQWPPCKS